MCPTSCRKAVQLKLGQGEKLGNTFKQSVNGKMIDHHIQYTEEITRKNGKDCGVFEQKSRLMKTGVGDGKARSGAEAKSTGTGRSKPAQAQADAEAKAQAQAMGEAGRFNRRFNLGGL